MSGGGCRAATARRPSAGGVSRRRPPGGAIAGIAAFQAARITCAFRRAPRVPFRTDEKEPKVRLRTLRRVLRDLREYLAITRGLPSLPTGTPAEGSIQVAGAPNDENNGAASLSGRGTRIGLTDRGVGCGQGPQLTCALRSQRPKPDGSPGTPDGKQRPFRAWARPGGGGGGGPPGLAPPRGGGAPPKTAGGAPGNNAPFRAFARLARVRGVAAQFSASPWEMRATQKRPCLPGRTFDSVPEALGQWHCARGAAAGGML